MTTDTSTIYRPGLPAADVHDCLRRSVADMRTAERNAVLWFAEVLNRKLYRDLGFATIHHYAADALGFSKAKTSQFIRLAASLWTLPKLRQAVALGEVSWTKAREVVTVATPKTEARWVDEARKGTRRELEQKVAEAKGVARALRTSPAMKQQAAGQQVLGRGADLAPGVLDVPTAAGAPATSAAPGALAAADRSAAVAGVDVPVTVQLRFSPVQYARFEKLVTKARALGLRGPREAIVLAALETEVRVAEEQRGRKRNRLRAGGPAVRRADAPGSEASRLAASDAVRRGPRERASARSPYQVVVYRCERCGAAHVPTSEGTKLLGPATIGAILCDAQVSDGGKRMRSTIAPRVRRRVLERDGYRCRMAGCGSTRDLEVHHRVPLALGGSDGIENLLALCGPCHRWVHEKLTHDITMDYSERFPWGNLAESDAQASTSRVLGTGEVRTAPPS
jgi:hypothetical protein